MEKYDNIIEELHETISSYKENLELLKNKFDQIKLIIDELNTQSGIVINTNESITEILSKVHTLNEENTKILDQFSDMTTKVSNSIDYFNVSSNQWVDNLNNHYKNINGLLIKQQEFFKDSIEKTLSEILNHANEGLVSLDKYFLTISTELHEEMNLFKTETVALLGEVAKSINSNFIEVQTHINLMTVNQETLQGTVAELDKKITSSISDCKDNQTELLSEMGKSMNNHFSGIHTHTNLMTVNQETLQSSVIELGKQFTLNLTELRNDQTKQQNELKKHFDKKYWILFIVFSSLILLQVLLKL